MVLAGGRGVHQLLPVATVADGIHSRQSLKGGSKAGVGRDGVPVRGRRPAADVRWEQLIARGVGKHLGWHDGAQRARSLLAAAYTATTKRTYMTAWERFESYCNSQRLRALPANYTTVAAYLGWLHLRGTVAASGLGIYLAPIDTVHELAGFPAPTANPVFRRLRKGYLRLDAARHGAMRRYAGPLPADVVYAALRLGCDHPSPVQRRVCAGLVLAFLMFNRPGAAAAMRQADMAFTPQGLRVQCCNWQGLSPVLMPLTGLAPASPYFGLRAMGRLFFPK